MNTPLRIHNVVCLGFLALLALPMTHLVAQENGAGGGPRLVGTYPLPDAVFDTEIVFYFDRPLAPADDPATLIQIVPPLQGTWSQGAQHVALAVKPDTKRKPERYVATFLPALTGTDGLAPSPLQEPIAFTNFQLGLSSLAFGTIGAHTTTLTFSFSATISWESLENHLRIADGQGAAVEYSVVHRSDSPHQTVTLPTQSALPFQVTILPGLYDTSRRFQTPVPIHQTLQGPGQFALDKLTWQHVTPLSDQIDFSVNFPVDPNAFLAYFQVVPEGSETPLTLEPHIEDESKQTTTSPSYRFDRPTEAYSMLNYRFTGTMDRLPPLYTQAPQQGTLNLKRDVLRIEYHNWQSEGADPLHLQLYFNGTVDPQAVLSHVELSPAAANLTAATGENGSIDLYGDWKTGTTYRLILRPGLRDQSDYLEMTKPQAWNPGEVPKRSGIGFAFETPYYFPRRTAGPMPLYGRNLKEAQATLYELFPSNLVKALDQMESGKAAGEFGWGLAEKIAEHTVTFDGPPDTRLEGNIPLDGFMPEDRKGIFGISVSPAYDYYNTKIVVWTDLGVLAHWQDDELLVYTHNLWDLTPVAGAKVTLYSHKHQIMGESQSNADGVARLANWNPELGTPKVVIVETADDYTFLPLQERSEDPVTYKDSMPPYDPDGYDAFLYADRNLYRPGETVHLRWLVRHADGSPLSEAPLTIKVVDPQNGKHSYTETLSRWGSGTLDVETKSDWLTGNYQVSVWVPGANVALTTQIISIEEFVPNRLSAAVTSEAPHWLPGEEHGITVHGDHLSGGPARERKTGAVVILEKRPWAPEGWDEYSFGNDAEFKTDVRDLGEGKTDENGNAAYTFVWHPDKNLSFPVGATIRGEVFEAGGRSVSTRMESTLFPADALTGLAVANAGDQNAIDVAVAAVQPDGQPAAIPSVEVRLEKRQWRYYVRRYSSHNEANWNEQYETLSTHTVPLSGGKGTVRIPFPEGWGNYRVRVGRPDEGQYATQTFYAYRGTAHLNDASRPSLIEMTGDKKNYVIGDTATVQITSPFDGNAIVVVQRDSIQEAHTVAIVNGAGTLSLPLDARHYPNIWLEATVIHPVEPGTALTYPYASFAMLNIPVHDPSKALGVSFEGLPEVMRPLNTLPVTIHVANADGTPAASEVTLALVDEGIHQILDYKNPDPVAWFQRPRRPEFRRAHYYDKVAYDFTGKPIGGGELLKKRLGEDDATVDDNWIKPLALWSGVVETDGTGVATINMELPEFAGKVRLVAVATSGTESGSTVANVTIRRPVVLQTTLPRFAAPGDNFSATALLQNKQDTPVKTTLRVESSDGLQTAPFENTWMIPGGGEIVVPVPVTVGEFPGSGTINWILNTTDEAGTAIDQFSWETPLRIQAPSIFQARSEMVVIAPGETREFVNTEFKENDRLETTLRVTPNALSQLTEALDYVIGYPYGCVEQTTSRCMPLFLLGQAAKQAGSEWDALYFQHFVQAGIDRLFTMQTASGGIGYWPGAGAPYNYGTIYAAHFLTLAKEDPAFEVPEEGYNQLMEYLREHIPLESGNQFEPTYNYAYACYVRSLSKDPQVMEDITSLDRIDISTTARQWLALAMLTYTDAPGDAVAYILNHPSTPYMKREQGGALNSSIRNDAITLMTQMALKLDSRLIQPQAEKLMRYLEHNRYNTHEAAFVITALAEYLKQYTGDLSQAQTTITTPDGVEERTGDFQFKATNTGAGSRYTVANAGPAPLYVHHTRAGILLNPDVAAESNGITVKREFLSETGKVSADDLKQGNTYLVSLEITCTEPLQNVVLVDLLPGGFDIENPRLDGGLLSTWRVTDGTQPSYIDVRDDRLIAAFDNLKSGTQKYYYAVRTVNAGTFRQPGANAECMYDLQFNGRAAGGMVKITK